MLSPYGKRRNAQLQTRNGQLCSRSCTTQPRHMLASQTENTRTRSYRLMNRRDQAHQRVLQARSTRSTTSTYKNACRLLQNAPMTKVRLLRKEGRELQIAADSNNIKGFYNGLKEVWGPPKKGPVKLKTKDEMETFSDSKRVLARWSEHFQKLLNVPGDIAHEALDNIPQRITKTSLD